MSLASPLARGWLLVAACAEPAVVADLPDAGDEAILRDACAISRRDAAAAAPANGWSSLLQFSRLRRLMAKTAYFEKWSLDLLPYLTYFDYVDDASGLHMQKFVGNWSSPGQVDVPGLVDSGACGIGLLCIHLALMLFSQAQVDEAGAWWYASNLVTIVRDLAHSRTNWMAMVRSGWPVFALLAWVSKWLAAKTETFKMLSLSHLDRPRWAIAGARTRLKRISGDVRQLAGAVLQPTLWRQLADAERTLHDSGRLDSLAARGCFEGMYCSGHRSFNRYTCACQRVFPKARARRKFCIISAHHKELSNLSGGGDVVTANFWTLAAVLNRWYAHARGDSFHWHLGHSFWCKVRVIRELLASRPPCEWVAWIDSDAYFATSEAMDAVVESAGDVDLVLPRNHRDDNFTAHFMLLKVCPVVVRFFDLVWDLPRSHPEIAGRFLRERFHDQSVMNLLLKREVRVDGALPTVAYLLQEDFGAFNSRMVVHVGGRKYEAFRLRLVVEVFARAKRCGRCRQDPLWRSLHAEMGNSSPSEALARLHQPVQWSPEMKGMFME